jgi:hypothetical protein
LKNRGVLNARVYAVVIILFFIGGSGIARLTGYWQTSISTNEYLFHVKHLSMPLYGHSRGAIPTYNKDAWLKMMKKIRDSRPGDMDKMS